MWIIAITAISLGAADEIISQITTILSQGAAVTTSRNDVEKVITEYGIAYLRENTMRERWRLLIYIAHPKFRGELMEELEEEFGKRFG